MKRVKHLVLSLGLLVQIAFAIDLPAAPTGFTWQEIPELKAAFLKPTGWYFKREEKKGTLAYFITKEDIGKNGQFQTGLTVNVFHLKKESAVEYARNFVGRLAKDNHAQAWSRETGPFQQFGCLYKDTAETGSFMTHTLMVANPKTNTLYLLIFESPESDWDVAWKTGEKIMDALAIDDEM
jgi:hypothetical protein